MRLNSWAIVFMGLIWLSACGGAKSGDSGTTTTSLSASFTTNCALSSCHGAGGGSAPSGTSKVVKGTTLTQAEFSSKIRNGVSATAMSAYSTATYSDADLTSDYGILKK